MKIRHPALIKAIGLIVAWIIRLWGRSLAFRYRPLGEPVHPLERGRGRFLYAFWHENLLLPAYVYANTPTHVLISEHADGRLIAQACRHLGLNVVAGSSTRGGVKAVLRILRLKNSHLVVTPDGPRGPRRQVQPGLVYLASRTGLPLVPVGIGYGKCWRLKSWDRFAVPAPGTGAVCVTGEPIVVPAEAGKEELERYRQLVQQAMDEVCLRAELLAGENGQRSREEPRPAAEVGRAVAA